MLSNFKAGLGTMLGVGAGLMIIAFVSDKLGITSNNKANKAE